MVDPGPDLIPGTSDDVLAGPDGVLHTDDDIFLFPVEGVEVFRRAYAAIDRGWMLGWTRWAPIVRPVDVAYRWFARNRLRLTGRQLPCPAKPRAIES